MLGVVVLGVGLLATAVASGPLADARHLVVAVNGVEIHRPELRNRLVLDEALIDVRRGALNTALAEGRVDPAQADRIRERMESDRADPLRTAIDGLVRDELLRQLASERGLTLETDPGLAVGRAATADLATLLRVVRLEEPLGPPPPYTGAWPPPARAGASSEARAEARSAALAAMTRALEEGATPAEVVAGLSAAGWRSSGGDVWLPRSGHPAALLLPSAIVATARDPETQDGSTLGPATDRPTGVSAVAILVARGTDSFGPAEDLPSRGTIDAGTLGRWAEARAAEVALVEVLADEWQAGPQEQVRAAELVIGTAELEGVDGAYRSFSHLVVGQLPPADRPTGTTDAQYAEQLVTELRALPVTERLHRFEALAARANTTPSEDPLRASGELGFFTKDQLVPGLAEPAFAEGASPGAVIGPVETVVGPEIFLIRARFNGVLDERANAALVEARTATDLLALARRVSPAGLADRADGTLWRSFVEIAADPVVRRAFVDTPLGERSDPIVFGGQILVVEPIERRIGELDGDALDRLLASGFESWLAERIAAATIRRDAEPLPGILVEPSPSADTSADPSQPSVTQPSQPAPSGGNPLIPVPTMAAPT
jgi:hypothetical protein